MKRQSFLVVAIGLLVAAAEVGAFCEQPSALVGTRTPYSLWGTCLTFSKLSAGSRVPLGSIVLIPKEGKNSPLTLSVERSALTKAFVEDLFDHSNTEILTAHPLAKRGVELVLTANRLKVIVHPGVVLRLRTDIPGRSNYRTFSGQPSFVVEAVPGEAYVSTDMATIQRSFSEISVDYRLPGKELSRAVLPDGSTQIIGAPVHEDDLPPVRRPRREEN
jgi:hypothetical protein